MALTLGCLCCRGSSSGSQAKPNLPNTDGPQEASAGGDGDGSYVTDRSDEERDSKRAARQELSRTLSDRLSIKQNGEDPVLAVQTFPTSGPPLTKSTASADLIVVRGPDWRWGEEDGGAGRAGRTLSVDRANGTIVVHWQATGLVQSHYRYGRRGHNDLAIAQGFSAEATQSNLLAMFRRGLSVSSKARNSQAGFAHKAQTVIIFDWDDTLFPSTFVRSDARLNLTLPLRDQKVSASKKKTIAASLASCAANAESLLRLACSYGKVILVTLARAPWVDDSCRLFYPRFGELLKKLGVRVVYAQERCQIASGSVPSSMSAMEAEAFWSAVKGRAISEEVKRFYSKYEGQSWKNIISIGDSNFERLGTMKAAASYMRDKGIDIPAKLDDAVRNGLVSNPGNMSAGFQANEIAPIVVSGQTFHVRTKVLKMIDEPTVEELAVELGLVQQWFPLMVRHDGGFSIDLAGVQDWDQARAIEEALRTRAVRTTEILDGDTPSSRGARRASFGTDCDTPSGDRGCMGEVTFGSALGSDADASAENITSPNKFKGRQQSSGSESGPVV